MHIDFRVRSVSASLPWILLITALPAGANESTAVFCGPPRIASIGGSFPRAPSRLARTAIIAPVATSHNRNPPVKLPNVGKMRQLPAEECAVGQCPTPALYGSWREELVEVKSIGPSVKFPEDGLHKGILEYSFAGKGLRV
ncbi:MAG: hypothetical protein E5X85_25130 [Mesorhizobium sp.]|nr:MAG: hypothetical protein E5X85_25130 [Mesorhizobium sp.]TJV89860.1 MAG: hypothetical protein E5X84_19465 [Mesorhizobium sp.]